MSPFEYVMVLVSIVIGLAITHVLTAISVGVHRLRGHGEPLELDPVYLLWVAYVLIWLISFWWYEFNGWVRRTIDGTWSRSERLRVLLHA